MTVRRIATIGSSTEPVAVGQRPRHCCIAGGLASVRPRPMNFARSVSQEALAPSPSPCTAIRCSIQAGRSSAERGRRVQRIACARRTISVCTNRLLKAGCAASAAAGRARLPHSWSVRSCARVRERLVMRDAAQLDVVFRRDGDLGVLSSRWSRRRNSARACGEDGFVAAPMRSASADRRPTRIRRSPRRAGRRTCPSSRACGSSRQRVTARSCQRL